MLLLNKLLLLLGNLSEGETMEPSDINSKVGTVLLSEPPQELSPLAGWL